MPTMDTRLEIRINDGLRRELKAYAAARDWPLALLVRELLREGLAREMETRRPLARRP